MLIVPDDYGDTAADATPLSTGATIEGNLDYDGDHDFFKVDLDKTFAYLVEVSHPTLRMQDLLIQDPAEFIRIYACDYYDYSRV